MLPGKIAAMEMRGISKSFGPTKVLVDVNLAIRSGEIRCLVGENGAGKSTLMKILSGLYRADAGDIFINGQPVHIRSPLDGLRQGIGVVYQELELVPDLSIAENIVLGREPRGVVGGTISWHEVDRVARQALTSVGLSVNPKTLVRRLTVSERQLVSIAKTLSYHPKLLVFDEPSAVLAGRDLQRLLDLIRSLRDDGCGIIYISHRLDEIFTIGDSVTVLRDGYVVDTKPITRVTKDQLIQQMVGREMQQIYPLRKTSASTDESLAVTELTGNILRSVTFSVRRGEIVGCAGLVGSGLDELARLVGGVDQPVTGSISVRGHLMKPGNPREAMRLGVALVPEDRKVEGLVLNQSIRDNMGYPFMALGGGIVRQQALANLTQEFRQRLDIKARSMATPVELLSGGNQQKVVFAKALSTHPVVLVLDEPTRGVDVVTKVEIYQIIDDIAQNGAAVLLISSELAELTGLSHRILVFSQGQLVAERYPPFNETEILRKALPTTESIGEG